MPLRKRCLLGVLIAVACALPACSGSSTTSPTTTTTTTGTSNQTMTALINGSAWTAVSVTASRSANLISINANDKSNPMRSISLSLIGASAGTYAMSTGASNAMLTIGPGESWSANVLGGSGTVTVSSLSSTGAAGTFSFTAVPANAASTNTEVVTSGVFSVTF